MTKLKTICLFICLLIALGFGLVKSQPATSEGSNVGADLSTAKHSAPQEKPKRIVSMTPGNTEILFALGAGDRVVGVTNYCDYPPQAKGKAKIGGYYTPDVEKIVALAPDIVFATGESQEKYIRILEQAGIRVISLEPKKIDELFIAIDIISSAIGEPEQGAALRAALGRQLDEVRRLTAGLPQKRVFVEIWDAPLITIGGKSHINDIIAQAGGVNVAANRPQDYMRSDVEALYAYDPEAYIIVSHSRGDKSRSVTARPELSDITAVKEKRIFKIYEDVLTRVGPRNLTGLRELAQALHPEAMTKRQDN